MLCREIARRDRCFDYNSIVMVFYSLPNKLQLPDPPLPKMAESKDWAISLYFLPLNFYAPACEE